MGGFLETIFKDMFFVFVGTFIVFFSVERLLDGSTISIREKIKILLTHPKNLDTERKKISLHYSLYLLGSALLTFSLYWFTYQFLISGFYPVLKELIFMGIVFLWGFFEIVNEYFYKESKINCKYYEKYGWKFVLKLDYRKEVMKNSPITFVREGVIFLVVCFTIILAIGIILFVIF